MSVVFVNGNRYNWTKFGSELEDKAWVVSGFPFFWLLNSGSGPYSL